MINIHQTAKNDVLDLLPNLVPFTKERLASSCPVSLLICTAGFEDRATSLAAEVAGCVIDALLILRYPTNVSENERSLATLRSIAATRTIEITYDRGNFRRTFRNAIEQLLRAEGATVVADISVMSSYLLYQVFEALVEHRQPPRVAVFYAEAETYHPSKDEWQKVLNKVQRMKDPHKRVSQLERSGFQSMGIDAIYESDTFPGSNISALPTQVVAVPNFSRSRMMEMLAYAESHYNASQDDTAWVIGQPPDSELNGWRFDAMKELYDPMRTCVPVGTRDYKQILWFLVDYWESLGTERHMVIAPLGSKMQHLGIYLFLKMRPDTGLILSEPKSFVAGKYSAGVGSRWWIDFGPADKLKSLITSYGMLQFRWD